MRDVERRGLGGAFVEVGVAAGHSSVLAALAASKYVARDFYLYDTFSGFPKDLPEEKDITGKSIKDYDLSKCRDMGCQKTTVQSCLLNAGVQPDQLFMLQAKAEETLPRVQPPSIAVLRLDADLFAPTYAALKLLYDRIEPGGVLIVDDYGHWLGCREAVDQFFAERGLTFQAEAWDYTCYAMRV